MNTITMGDEEITVDAALVARGFGLAQAKLQSLMRAGKITSRCEKWEAEDAGRYRLNFLFGNRVLRLTVDRMGNLLGPARIEFVGSPQAPARPNADSSTEE